jgi:hypothetical protein
VDAVGLKIKELGGISQCIYSIIGFLELFLPGPFGHRKALPMRDRVPSLNGL